VKFTRKLLQMYRAAVPDEVRWKLLPAPLRRVKERRRKIARHAEIDRVLAHFPNVENAPSHNLPGQLFISLTSYPKRFPTLHKTLQSLLDQRMRPDAVILWIAREDAGSLPEKVLDLRQFGLTIKFCDNLRSFKKIIPVLMENADAFILIADDDVYYEPDWVSRFAEAFDVTSPTIVCTRAHRLKYKDGGVLAPYRDWESDVQDTRSEQPSRDLVPTGCGGVLYPPGSLPASATKLDDIAQYCATCDDTWLFFMAHHNGWATKRVGGKAFDLISWPNTQQESLKVFHKNGLKDQHIADMSKRYGIPKA
jgi:hypothetical protein